MKVLKGCFSAFLSLLTLIITISAFIILSLQATLLNSNVVTKLIDRVEIKELIPIVFNQLQESETELKQASIDQETIDTALDQLEQEDYILIKDTIKDGVKEFYQFINGKTENFYYEIDLTKFSHIIAKVLVSSPKMMKDMDLPFEICKNGQNNCIPEDDFVNLFSRALTNDLTSDDLLEIFPQCPSDYKPPTNEEMPNCIPQGMEDEFKTELDQYLEENNNLEIEEQQQDSSFDITKPIVISSEDMPQIWEIRRVLTMYVKPAPYILLSVSALLMGLILLVQGASGLMWIGILSILEGVLLASGKVTTQYTKTIAINQLQLNAPQLEPETIAKTTDLAMHFVDNFNNHMAIYGLIMIGIGTAAIFTWNLRKKRKYKEELIKDNGVSSQKTTVPPNQL